MIVKSTRRGRETRFVPFVVISISVTLEGLLLSSVFMQINFCCLIAKKFHVLKRILEMKSLLR